MNAIQFANVSKIYTAKKEKTLKEVFSLSKKHIIEPTIVLQDSSFAVKKGQNIGIIGQNGAGKSTVLKMIAGVTKPTAGRIIVSGRVCPLIELGAGFHPDLTGKENILINGLILGLSKKQIAARFEQIVAFSELAAFIDTPVKYYSSGMYMRLAFSVAIHADPDILLIDEILSVGDAPFQEKCHRAITNFTQSKNVTTVFVSHSLDVIRTYCQKSVLLTKHHSYFGQTTTIINRYLASIKPKPGTD